jgi:pimeloyl-ACP methyl ester carboxylesterase
LVFVHGWSCDARYWREQIPYFSKTHRTITLDLAGHGHSGAGRKRYTQKAYGEDVAAVVEAAAAGARGTSLPPVPDVSAVRTAGGGKVILVGHSMGGPIAAEAARLLPGRVLGIVGVDTFDSIAYPLKRAEMEAMLAPMRKDFRAGCRTFVEPMLSTRTDARLRDWILADMESAPPRVGISTLEETFSLYLRRESAKVFDGLGVPIRSVNADLWPIDYEANRKHMGSFEASILKGADHFLMLARPKEFNGELEKAIVALTAKRTVP